MRSRYIYDRAGNMLYAEERGEVLLNKLDTYRDPGYFVMPDVQPFVSMIDGSVITSRGKYRKHLREHGCVEVGNDSSLKNPVLKPLAPPPGRKEDIIRAVNQIEERKRR